MKPFHYDPLDEPLQNANNTSRPNSGVRPNKNLSPENAALINKAAAENGADPVEVENALRKYTDVLDNDTDGSDNNDDLIDEEINDNNAEAIFAKCAISDRLLFNAGQVLYKTYTYFDAPGVFLVIMGFLLMVGGLPGEHGKEFQPEVAFTGAIMLVIGIVLKKMISSYAVLDYKNGKVYNESYFKSNSIYKSKPVLRSDILSISVDHRKPEASIDNLGNISALQASNKDNKDPYATEAAVAFLLKNGTIYHFNSFSASLEAQMFCIRLAKAISKSWKIPYVETDRSKKLTVKKYGNKYSFGSVGVYSSAATASESMSSALRILISVGLILAGLAIIIILVVKLG